MKTDRLAAEILHAIGMPARWNDEFVLDAIAAVAAWRRYSRESAAKWLKARAVAAQELGITVGKWWFINAEYRADPRPVEVNSSDMPGKENCSHCSGSGFRVVQHKNKAGRVGDYAVRCECRGGAPAPKNQAATLPQIGALADAKSM